MHPMDFAGAADMIAAVGRLADTLTLAGSPTVWFPALGAATFVGLAGVFGVPAVRRSNRRGRHILKKWTRGYGFRACRVQLRLFRRGPFFAKSTARQVVFRIKVEDTAGQQRAGYARVGHASMGTEIRQISVKWDGVPGMVHEKV